MYKIFTQCKFKIKEWFLQKHLDTKMVFTNYNNNNEMAKLVIDSDYSMRLYYTKDTYYRLTKNENITKDYFKSLSDCNQNDIQIKIENKKQNSLNINIWASRGKTSIKKMGPKCIMGKYLFYYDPEEKCPKIRKRQILTDLLIYFSNDKYFTCKRKMCYIKCLEYFEGIYLDMQTPLCQMKNYVKHFKFK